jgi:hypothetical protein
LDYFVNFKTNYRNCSGLIETQDDCSYIVHCKFSCSEIPQSIHNWSEIQDNIISVRKIFIVSDCPICLDTIESEQDIVVLECAHCFCSNCHKKISQCPLCKSRSIEIITKIVKPSLMTESQILLSKSDLLGYKVVGVVIQQNPSSFVKLTSIKGDQLSKGIMLNKVSALLSLQIEADDALVYKVEKGSGIIAMNKLKSGVKYCTNAVRIVSVRFIGDQKQVKQSLMAYQTGNARFVSYHDKDTEYPLQKKVRVETAGQGCGNAQCGHGIYFFTDVESTIGFWQERNPCVLSDKPSTPWMSEPVVLSNGFRAIKLSQIEKQEIIMDNYLTNQRQLQEWCDNNQIKHLKENNSPMIQIL